MTSKLEFINVDQPEGLKKLNDYLEDNSYIVGFSPTKHDTHVIEQLDDCAKDEKYPHISRWYKHIKSFSAKERQAWKMPANISVSVTRLSPKAEAFQDDDFDPFANETEEENITAKKVITVTKAAKPKKIVINRSQLVIDVKPGSIDTNLDMLEQQIKSIQMDGLEWSVACKKVPIAFGLSKLQIGCIIVDDLVNTDDILARIECIGLDENASKKYLENREKGDDEDEVEGMVQSADIVSFNKL